MLRAVLSLDRSNVAAIIQFPRVCERPATQVIRLGASSHTAVHESPIPFSAGSRTVLLLHEQPGLVAHYDWLTEAAWSRRHPDEDPQERSLNAFRISRRLDHMTVGDGWCEMTRIEPHRRRYLSYEGAVSQGRGRVRQVTRGSVLNLSSPADGGLMVVVQWNTQGCAQRLMLLPGEPPQGESWRVRCLGHDGAAQ